MEQYSVLMSVYYREKPQFLKQSIESMMSQTYKTNDFVIVCDGGLTAELDQVIEEFRQREENILNVVRLPKNVGLGNALKEGIVHCKNELIARMDSDDISDSRRCEEQVRIMTEKKLDICSGTIEEFRENTQECLSKRILPRTQKEIEKGSKRRNPFNHPAVMYRKSKVLESGNYIEYPGFEDYYLWVRMLRRGAKAHNLEQTLVYMRIGDGMYERRGGLVYMKKAVRFRWQLKKLGYSSMLDFIISAGGQLVVTLMPVGIREDIYKKILRK